MCRKTFILLAILLVFAGGLFLFRSNWKAVQAGERPINGTAYRSGKHIVSFSNGEYRFTAGFNKTRQVAGQYWNAYEPRAAILFSFDGINRSSEPKTAFELFGDVIVRQGETNLAFAAEACDFEAASDYWEQGIGILPGSTSKATYKMAYLLKDQSTPITISIKEPETGEMVELAKLEIKKKDFSHIQTSWDEAERLAAEKKSQAQKDPCIKGGTHLVGSDLEPGEYLVIGDEDRIVPHALNLSWDEGLEAADGTAKRTYVKVSAGQWISFSGKAILAEKAPAYNKESYETGVYKVGKDMEPGKYFIKGISGDYRPKAEILTDVRANQYKPANRPIYLEVGEKAAIGLKEGQYLKLVDVQCEAIR